MSILLAVQFVSHLAAVSQRRIGVTTRAAHKKPGAHLLAWLIATFDVTAPANSAAKQDGEPDHMPATPPVTADAPASHLFLLDIKVGR